MDLVEMAAEQRRVVSLCDYDVSGLQHPDRTLPSGNINILCNVSTGSHHKFFSYMPNLSHPGSRAIDKLDSDLFPLPWDSQGPESLDTDVYRLSAHKNP
ncbi:unnamed protein product [Schistocephalus solidus]|uniref:Endo/exonuclease/phosphatase domain-containing protein n=1 Tax=Schistocephalus solidus TaxID=70667 RepID=A0A183TUH6_SCHSO|nr:unnamed protein product [Schistocephalus solidus]